MNKTKKIILGILCLIVLIQFFPTHKNVSEEKPENVFFELYNTPQDIQDILRASCFDCHSNNTHYPWYNKIQPIAWLLEHHVNEARSELNFDEFNKYDKKYKKYKIKEIWEEIEKGEMPLKSYLWMHGEAKLTQQQKNRVIKWVKSIKI